MQDPLLIEAMIRVGVAGGIAGLIGGFIAIRSRQVLGVTLLGIIGGIAGASIARLFPGLPIGLTAGEGFSLMYAAIGGAVLGIAVGGSTA